MENKRQMTNHMTVNAVVSLSWGYCMSLQR